ncbi:MAG: Rpn family recombination-promoting nuclease/putative transposase [Candidatus Chromulinivorax sp.]
MKMNFANPKTDFTFKRLFGSENHKRLTISLLNNILGRTKENAIIEITFCNTENIPAMDSEKESYLDILCTDQLQNNFIIEMQVAKEQGFRKRSFFYTALGIVEQMHKGDDYTKIKPVIFIGILNHPMFANKDRVISHHIICDMDTKQQSFQEGEWHYVELCNFHTSLENLQTDTDKWLYFLKHAENLTMIPNQFAESAEFQEAFEVIEQSLWTPQERRVYLKSLDELNKNNRLQAGIFEEGFHDGFEKGQFEEKQANAINFLKMGISVEQVAHGTGLTIDQVKDLKQKL